MTVYKGTINCRKFADLLHSIFIKEGYEEISSEHVLDGRVYRSSKTKEDEFYVRMKDPVSRYVTVGIYEGYEPNAVKGISGTFGSGILFDSVIWNSSVNADTIDLNYVINANNKRVVIWVEGMRAQPGRMNSITYIGLPNRISTTDKDGRFAGIANTANGVYDNHSVFYSLRNRNETLNFPYPTDFYLPTRSLGWGNKLFFSEIIVGSTAEGMRGSLDGIRIIEKTDPTYEILAGDVFTEDGKTYMLVTPTSHGYDTLHTGFDYLIEI